MLKFKFTLIVIVILFATNLCHAQLAVVPPPPVSKVDAATGQLRLEQLRKATAALEDYQATLASDSTEYRDAAALLAKVGSLIARLASPDNANISNEVGVTKPSVSPDFSLSVPAHGRTNVTTEPVFSWTEDRRNGSFQNPPLYNLREFRLEIATDKAMKNIVHTELVTAASARVTANEQAPSGTVSIATSSTPVGENILESGTKYYWQVIAIYSTAGGNLEQRAANGPSSFITSIDPFNRLAKRGFSLQRTVDSKDATEGAQFAFLKNFDGKSVYSTDFAFFWDSGSRSFNDERGSIRFRPAVEGKLTSDNSTSEDAWRFSAGAVIDYAFAHSQSSGQNFATSKPLIDGIYFDLGGRLEGSQKFETSKLVARTYFTPHSRKLAIGVPFGRIDSAFQFMWRPSVEFNAGHTFERGDSAETNTTVLRLVPRVRATLYTRALSRALKMADSYFYLDNTFYYLPKEQVKTRHNYFTSGFELLFMKNFGFGLTYKSGESAPKFKRVNNFGGVLTVRFGDAR